MLLRKRFVPAYLLSLAVGFCFGELLELIFWPFCRLTDICISSFKMSGRAAGAAGEI